jgi:hypothetical protein
VLQAGHSAEASLFPFEGLIISLQIEMAGNRSVEVASIGMEGAVGGIVSCGTAPAFANAWSARRARGGRADGAC